MTNQAHAGISGDHFSATQHVAGLEVGSRDPFSQEELLLKPKQTKPLDISAEGFKDLLATLAPLCDPLKVSPTDWQVGQELPLNLTPTESIRSPGSRAILGAFRNNGYLHARPDEPEKAQSYVGIGAMQKLYQACVERGKALFKAEYLLPDFPNGMSVMQNSILAFTKAGEHVLSIAPARGGHPYTASNVEMFGRKSLYIPFDIESQQFDVQAVTSSLNGASPGMIYLDMSNLVVPLRLEELKEQFPGVPVVFDASQVLGLIAGGAYPNPLDNGADIMVGSAHKSLYGPIQGIAATRSEDLYRELKQAVNILVSNNDLAHIAALAFVFEEFSNFGRAFASRLIDNANSLATFLKSQGWELAFNAGISNEQRRTQHVWASPGAEVFPDGNVVMIQGALASIGVTTNVVTLEDRNGNPRMYLRFGTLEMTQRGAVETDMNELALAVTRAANGDRDGARHGIQTLKEKLVHVTHCCQPHHLDALGFVSLV